MSYAPRILVIDSELAFQLFAEDTLSSIGYSVAVANTKQLALAQIRNRAFDAVIVSLDLPGENRGALMRQIRTQLPDVPILATSNRTVEREVAAGESLVLKPVAPETLLLEIYRLLDPRQTWAGHELVNPAIGRVLLALKILTSSCYPDEKNAVVPEELEELLSYLGDDARGLTTEQIACLVIQREIKRQEGAG